ncbi:MAG: organic solvent transporter substrate-binding protein [Solirubrobacterales bacterium]|nr:organic solvent transporter substrate-binding protein [Solirubrobacterales bacterium]
MTARTARIVPWVLGVVAVFVLVIVLGGRDDGRTHLKLTLDSAGGLQNGSQASIGGVSVGRADLKLGKGDKVDVDITLDKGKVIPKDARIAISAVNFLGQKQISFSGGDISKPAPDGYEFPASRVTTSTDLDQVLNTLDADTRTRLAIVVNEAGASVMGRKWDIGHFVQEAPTTLADANTLLDRLVTDNHTLSDLVTSSDRFIASTTAKRADLTRMVDTLGQTAKTVETKRTDLRATLAKAPGTLTTLRRFLDELERTTVPLGPAAREITAAAPALDQTLSRVDAFRTAADPTLRTATSVAPKLTQLAIGATPTLRKAEPVVRSLAGLAKALPPLSSTLDHSADNLLATIENWSQAIQLRDGVSHIFRGEATFSPDLLTSVLDRLTKPADANRAAGKAPARKSTPEGSTDAPAAPSGPTTPDAPAAKPENPVKKVTDGTTKTVTDVLEQLLGPKAGGAQSQPGSDPPASDPGKSAQSLLDFLLGP